MTKLIRYDAMCRAIEAAHKVDEVKDIRDRAIAMEAYFRQAKNRENERKAERIRLRAERRSGELLAEREKLNGRPRKASAPSRLSDLGISHNQSAHWQKVAQVPKAAFEKAIESPKPTVAINGIVKKANRSARERELASTTKAVSETLGQQVYGVIYADPPWRFEPYSRETGMDRAADNHYPTMMLEQIKALKIPAAEDCALFLWATVPMLPEAIQTIEAWGFTYRSHTVWPKKTIGTGYWFRNMHELLLLATKGNVPAPAPGDQYASVIEASWSKHSEKPAAAAEMIEDMFPTLPRLEMFARVPRLGWDVWGNETLNPAQ